ncbi:Eukaryotic aspartyl protease family protein [Klebsormidium nitens]|uniref:Eukaryotic aspartyl protease family protein n=1 Tax=Klebsormidium nitens TaxID=105231 RepID=A0A1Y1HNH9_KLENI|nr:Eukaryotic aspartyl protease family protein [Klebsormidium nitens]|eukprot:GAQ78166.1 Eukaryotic aspartyl protease family protein [Klebsormidium nitens]
MKGEDGSIERAFSTKGSDFHNRGADSSRAAVPASKENRDPSQTVSPFEHNKALEEAEASPIVRLTHRAKTERPPPPTSVHSPSPPGTISPFSSLDHEHLLAADAARRALISSSKIALGGSTIPLGYYFAEIALGTPPQRFQMIVDTGSAIMYVPAKECVSCGRGHESPPYDHGASSTYSLLLCSAATCAGSTPATCPSPDSPCLYQQHYSEGSSTSGTVAIDVLWLPGVTGASKIMFGCETRETGLLYTQAADGIIGLGRGPGSIIAQLAQQRAVEDAFSLCFGGVEGGGAMVFGSVGVLPGTVWVPMLPQTSMESMYFADVYGLQVGGSAVSLDSGSVPVTAMVDSGTTYTYLPSVLYGPLVARLLQAIPLSLVPVPKRSLSAACWGKVTSLIGPSSPFPTMGFVFANGVVVELPPDNYLFKHPSLGGAYCLGIFSSGQHGATIGGISVHNLLVTYDRAHQLFGFARLNCSAMADGSLTLPKPQTSFPNLNAPNKTRYANTSAPTYARIPFRTANMPAMNASSLASARARDPVPNPWAATLEGLLYDESPAPVPASGMGKSPPETEPPGTAEKADGSAQGNEPVTGASTGHER